MESGELKILVLGEGDTGTNECRDLAHSTKTKVGIACYFCLCAS
jgi:hypothetical protein